MGDTVNAPQTDTDGGNRSPGPTAPHIVPATGGGAIRGIGETFTANAVTGTGTLALPIAVSEGRAGFTPNLQLTYDSGNGNGPFGMGWSMHIPSITRRTDRGIPQYRDRDESDIYILAGAEDLVPVLVESSPSVWTRQVTARNGYVVTQYRPRIEGLFAIIERWVRDTDSDTYWRSISKDNVTTYYGQTVASRIVDPDDASHVYSWLIDQTQDDIGNVMIYEYEAETSANVDLSQSAERNRTPAGRAVNQYVKRIKYGNTPSLLTTPIAQLQWLFEVVFDYGEGHYAPQPPDANGQVFATASLDPTVAWPARQDPFSRYRAAFEIRTYRLCQRVLMFHHFATELGTPDYLVRVTEFTYDQTPIASFMTAVTASGCVRQPNGSYLVSSLPPVEFTYSAATVHRDVRDVDPASLANLPAAVDGGRYQWLDLDGEGLQGVLAEEREGWYYKRNLSPLSLFGGGEATVTFEAETDVDRLPAMAAAGTPAHTFMDLAGDGRLDCVVLDRPGSGFYKRGQGEQWHPWEPLQSAPNVDWRDPNGRFLDVDGDGFTELLITEQDTITYYPSLATDGFGAPQRVAKATDEELGPAIVFADPTHSIFLADMSGDGLADIVRVRNGEICYWPNLGYGQFGAKVDMDGAPWFDAPDLFDPRRIRLADIDGSGPTDVIYLAPEGVQLYQNQSGNAWSVAESVVNYPVADTLASIQALDLLGNGTSCLVWTSSLPGSAGRTMRYIDLMGGQKPYLLVAYTNHLGADTTITYLPSTAFYLADRTNGQPWATRLPFPVQVVARVDRFDRVSRNRFTTRYAYHHGYFDSIEREFRGFGMVEQWDTDDLGILTSTGALPDAANVDAASYVPPVYTKTWCHIGAYPSGARVTRIYDAEYWQEPGLTPAQNGAMGLPDSVMPDDVTGPEIHEALRSLKGMILRKEVYAADGTALAPLPYAVSETNYTIVRLQPYGGNRHAVFFAQPREAAQFAYDRRTYPVSGGTYADPRVSHSVNLVVDDYGNVLQSAAIAYGRRYPDTDPLLTPNDQSVQSTTRITYTQRTVTNPVLDLNAYRAPMPAETRTYELVKVAPGATAPNITNLFQFDELTTHVAQAADGSHDLPYTDLDATGAIQAHPYQRLIEHVRMLYRADDLSAALVLGSVESMALPYRDYKLALTPDLLPMFERGGVNLLPAPMPVLAGEGGYALSDDLITAGLFPPTDPSGHWWVPSGQVFCSPSASDTPAQELAQAHAHFFLGRRYRDAFGGDTIVAFDPSYDLFLMESQDAALNTITATYDCRVLKPTLVTDANGNRAAALFDALGRVAATAVMGKTTESLGDSLTGVVADLTQAQIDAFFANPEGLPAATLLSDATVRFVYDVGRFMRLAASPSPVYAATITRETHVSDLPSGGTSARQVSLAYSDGLGRIVQRKSQCEPGPVLSPGPTVDPRWVGSGWTILNNKGKPVRQYEPFFDATHDFAYGVTVGVSPILFYDPIGRCVATVHPDRSWDKIVLDPWRQAAWDVNDTVLITDPSTDADVGAFVQRVPTTDYLPTWYTQALGGTYGAEGVDAANKAAVHAATPSSTLFDPLGRPFLTLAFNRAAAGGGPPVESHWRSLMDVDIEGNQRSITDALGRTVLTCAYDLLGVRIGQTSVDSAERWSLSDVAGKPLRTWDSRAHTMRYSYDVLRRPTQLFVQDGAAPERTAETTTYGEGAPSATPSNLKGRVWQQRDGAGLVTNLQFDFKGNLLSSARQLLEDYADPVDWGASPALEAQSFTSRTTYDALNRPTTLVMPDGSVVTPTYNQASLVTALAANIGGAATATPFVTEIDYDAKGQRTQVTYGNASRTTLAYDPNTFRLTNLATTRTTDGATLQDLSYVYDPIGNVTHLSDAAQQTVYFKNAVVDPSADYVFDALYRLIRAEGRELIGLTTQPQTTWNDIPRMQQPSPSDGSALRSYTESYQYDSVGNLQSLAHVAPGGSWTRTYAYDQPNVPPTTNRLTSTTVGLTVDAYAYDAHGNMTAMPQLAAMGWDFKDQLQMSQQQVVESGPAPATFYVYDAKGHRVRKVNRSAAGAIVNERIYLGGYEVYREYASTGTETLERTTLHIMDGTRRVALVDRTTTTTTQRYQYDNHLGSAVLELDEAAGLISYEEYYPYGATSYQAGSNAAQVSLKRYRYTGKERDNETGLYYHGARYMAPWLGRWISCDPLGLVDGPCVYAYVRNNPIIASDPTGAQGDQPNVQKIAEVTIVGQTPNQIADKIEKTTGYKATDLAYMLNLGPARMDVIEDYLEEHGLMHNLKPQAEDKAPASPLTRPFVPTPDQGSIGPPIMSRDEEREQQGQRMLAEYHEAHPTAYDVMAADSQRLSKAMDPLGSGMVAVPISMGLQAFGMDPDKARAMGVIADFGIGAIAFAAGVKAPGEKATEPTPSNYQSGAPTRGVGVEIEGSQFSVNPKTRVTELMGELWSRGYSKEALSKNGATVVGMGMVDGKQVTVIATQNPSVHAGLQQVVGADEILLPVTSRNPHPDVHVFNYLQNLGATRGEMAANPMICFGCQDTIGPINSTIRMLNPKPYQGEIFLPDMYR